MSLCIEEILSDSNLAAARASFKGKNDSSGMDGVRVSELGEYWNVNGDKIKKTIFIRRYRLTDVTGRMILLLKVRFRS